jgi:hypothetical protein
LIPVAASTPIAVSNSPSTSRLELTKSNLNGEADNNLQEVPNAQVLSVCQVMLPEGADNLQEVFVAQALDVS